ncbi:hypothetical protein Tco_0195159, partial [Tanacetum coccineum]
SMIGCLMYLTASRPDIMFAVCLCARFQVTPKVSHMNAVKRIFRYLKHQPKLGLWYPKDSPFHLEAFSDSDYAGDNHDRRSTSGGCQYLGRRLVSWQCKKQTIVAISSTEAEYVAAASCCGQVLWMQNQLFDYGFNFMNTEIHIDNESTICIVKNPVFHSKTKHIQIRHHFIRDCYDQRLINVVKVHTDDNVADLLTKGFDLASMDFARRFDAILKGRVGFEEMLSEIGRFLCGVGPGGLLGYATVVEAMLRSGGRALAVDCSWRMPSHDWTGLLGGFALASADFLPVGRLCVRRVLDVERSSVGSPVGRGERSCGRGVIWLSPCLCERSPSAFSLVLEAVCLRDELNGILGGIRVAFGRRAAVVVIFFDGGLPVVEMGKVVPFGAWTMLRLAQCLASGIADRHATLLWDISLCNSVFLRTLNRSSASRVVLVNTASSETGIARLTGVFVDLGRYVAESAVELSLRYRLQVSGAKKGRTEDTSGLGVDSNVVRCEGCLRTSRMRVVEESEMGGDRISMLLELKYLELMGKGGGGIAAPQEDCPSDHAGRIGLDDNMNVWSLYDVSVSKQGSFAPGYALERLITDRKFCRRSGAVHPLLLSYDFETGFLSLRREGVPEKPGFRSGGCSPGVFEAVLDLCQKGGIGAYIADLSHLDFLRALDIERGKVLDARQLMTCSSDACDIGFGMGFVTYSGNVLHCVRSEMLGIAKLCFSGSFLHRMPFGLKWLWCVICLCGAGVGLEGGRYRRGVVMLMGEDALFRVVHRELGYDSGVVVIGQRQCFAYGCHRLRHWEDCGSDTRMLTSMPVLFLVLVCRYVLLTATAIKSYASASALTFVCECLVELYAHLSLPLFSQSSLIPSEGFGLCIS